MIIDVHGHYTTAPKALEDWRNRQIAGIKDRLGRCRKCRELKISDDELRETIDDNQLKKMQERGSDLTIFSPRASFMAHHIGDFNVSSTWAAICNDLIYRVSQLFPNNFIGVAMLPQSPGVDPEDLHPRAGALRQRLRLRRHQPQSRSVGRALDRAAADRPVLVSALREDGGARHSGHDPRLHLLQSLLPRHRRALSQRRHHRLHAVHQLAICSRISRR